MQNRITEQPLVTIYMPTYNRIELLKRAVDSVLNQDYKNIELIVVDDMSTDETPQYLAKKSEQDSRFKYFINYKNSGACVSRNKAIVAARGEFITGLDDDDYFLPDRVSNLINFWIEIHNSSTDCIAIYTNSFVKNENNQLVPIKRKNSCTKKDLICSNYIGNQLFTRTIYMKNIGGFDGKLAAWQDLECWYRLLDSCNSKAYLEPSYSYVIDISHAHERITNKKTPLVISAYYYICKKHKLTYNYKKVLELQLLPYTKNFPSLNSVIRRVAFMPKLLNIKESSAIIYHAFKNKIGK